MEFGELRPPKGLAAPAIVVVEEDRLKWGLRKPEIPSETSSGNTVRPSPPSEELGWSRLSS